MDSAAAAELLTELAQAQDTTFAIPHGAVSVRLDGASAGRPRIEGEVAHLANGVWNASVDLRDVNSILLMEERIGREEARRAVVFADTAGEPLLRTDLTPTAGDAVWSRWAQRSGVRRVSLTKEGGAALDRDPFLATLGEISEALRASKRINFVLAVGSSVFEAFPPTYLDRLSLGEGYMTLANDGIHIHVDFRRVESLRFCEEHGGVSGRGLPLSLSVKFCAAGGRTLLKAIFPFPHLDDDFKPCDVQPERIEFFKGVQACYVGRPGVELWVASASASPLPEPIAGELIAA